MKYSLEQVFPEVNKLDYDRLVQPLLTFNRNHLNLLEKPSVNNFHRWFFQILSVVLLNKFKN